MQNNVDVVLPNTVFLLGLSVHPSSSLWIFRIFPGQSTSSPYWRLQLPPAYILSPTRQIIKQLPGTL